MENDLAENEPGSSETSTIVAEQAGPPFDETTSELDNIQKDLTELLQNLDEFICDNPDSSDSEDDFFDPVEKSIVEDDLNKLFYNEDNSEERKLNWDSFLPFVNHIVGDLEKLRKLNNQTNSVVTRINDIIQKKVPYELDIEEPAMSMSEVAENL